MYEVSIRTSFAAAHRLHNYCGKCESLHGHNFLVEVGVEGQELDRAGLLLDFKVLKAIVREVLEELDHSLLNDHEHFAEENPSSERIASFLHHRVQTALPSPSVRVSFVRVWESESAAATYRQSRL